MNSSIRNALGERIDYSWQAGTGALKQDNFLVILGHGVTGNKDRPIIVDTATALNAAGFDTLRFSFSGNGNSEGAFTESTISKEVADLGAVLDHVADSDRTIAYIGHSMGAAVGVLRAATDNRIQLLVSLAGMVHTRAFANTEFGNEEPDTGCMWEDPDCPLSSAFMLDLCQTIQSVLPSAAKINIPWLLLHGSADDVVLPQDSAAVQSAKGEAVTLVSMEGADHSFSDPTHKRVLAKTVTEWLVQQANLAS